MTTDSKRKYDLYGIAGNFRLSGKAAAIGPTGEGHINDTFLIKTGDESDPDYILQRVNNTVFADVPGLMENMARVVRHILIKPGVDGELQQEKTARLIYTVEGNPFYLDEQGNYWRCFEYCRNSYHHFKDVSVKRAYEGGKILGDFQAMLLDLPGGPLYETIPDFHHLAVRLHSFDITVENGLQQRIDIAAGEIEEIELRREEMLAVDTLARNGTIPWRVTHNDTKFNNILFDKHENALCIIDLDTVMNGAVLYDFGDALRTLGNTAAEDDPNLSRVDFNMALFEPFARGYLKGAGGFLTPIEIKYLAHFVKFMTYIMAVRFLTDYLAGDLYYKISRPAHNLDRARNQIRLLKSVENKFDQMERILQRFSAG